MDLASVLVSCSEGIQWLHTWQKGRGGGKSGLKHWDRVDPVLGLNVDRYGGAALHKWVHCIVGVHVSYNIIQTRHDDPRTERANKCDITCLKE